MEACWVLKFIKKAETEKYFGHVKRHDGLEKRVMVAFFEGKRRRGRPRCGWERSVKEGFGTMQKAGRLAGLGHGFREPSGRRSSEIAPSCHIHSTSSHAAYILTNNKTRVGLFT